MIITVIPCKSAKQITTDLQRVADKTDGIELRLDYWDEIDFVFLRKFLSVCVKPIIFTLRRCGQGGKYIASEDARLQMLWRLAELKPHYIDLEFDSCKKLLADIAATFPEIQIISSYHDFNQTPQNLHEIYFAIQNPFARYYKIVTYANDEIDAVRMLIFTKKANNIIAFCMGEAGLHSRFLNRTFGSVMTYVSVNKDAAVVPGQLSLTEFSRRILHPYGQDTL